MLGGLLPSRASGILVSWRSSFWTGTFVIVMVGCCASKPLMALRYMPSNGWLVALFHQVRVTLAAVLGLGLPALLAVALLVPAGVLVVDELPLLHAAAAVAVVTASATTASARLLRMCSPDRGLTQGIFSKVFGILSACRHRKDGRHRGQPPVSMVLRTFSSLDDSRTMLREQRSSVDLRYREVSRLTRKVRPCGRPRSPPSQPRQAFLCPLCRRW